MLKLVENLFDDSQKYSKHVLGSHFFQEYML